MDFSDLGTKNTTYIAHVYYRYPAKFIPQITTQIIEKYTQADDIVIELFSD
ncbi:MAG: hypothetical protein AAF770_01005 [Bacteroidota bacterium]